MKPLPPTEVANMMLSASSFALPCDRPRQCPIACTSTLAMSVLDRGVSGPLFWFAMTATITAWPKQGNLARPITGSLPKRCTKITSISFFSFHSPGSTQLSQFEMSKRFGSRRNRIRAVAYCSSARLSARKALAWATMSRIAASAAARSAQPLGGRSPVFITTLMSRSTENGLTRTERMELPKPMRPPSLSLPRSDTVLGPRI